MRWLDGITDPRDMSLGKFQDRDPSARYRPTGCPKGPGPIVPVPTVTTGPLSASSPYSPSQAGPPTRT